MKKKKILLKADKTKFEVVFTELITGDAQSKFMSTATRITAHESNPRFYPWQRNKKSALAIQPRIYAKKQINGKYMNRGYNSAVTRQKIIYEL